MAEKYPSLLSLSPSPSAKKEKTIRQLSSLLTKKEEYFQRENEWMTARECQEDSADESLAHTDGMFYYVFNEASKLAMARLEDSYKRIVFSVEGSERFQPTIDNMSKGRALIHHWLDTHRSGVSLADILKRGKDLAHQKPAAVYGHMLLSTSEPIVAKKLEEGAINFLPITSYSGEELRTLFKQARFPAHINDILKELSGLYQHALREVNKSFFEPDSPHFPAVAELYQELAANNNPIQMGLFHSQILGMNRLDQGRKAYGKLGALIREGNHSTMHQDCFAFIEDSFEGMLGEEAYELFGIEQLPEAELNAGGYSEAHRKKQNLLKLLKDTRGTICLADGQYGQLELAQPEIHYQKMGAKTWVTLAANAQTTDKESVPIDFQLSEKNTYAWCFLRSGPELPEVFNAMVQSTDEALQEAISQNTNAPTTSIIQVVSPKKERSRDEIYELRKVHRRERRQSEIAAPALADQPIEEVSSPTESSLRRFPVVFPEDLASSLPEDIRANAAIAIAKYSEGLPNVKFTKYISLASNEKILRLRHGQVRVIAKLVNGVLIVTRVGMREDIYS